MSDNLNNYGITGKFNDDWKRLNSIQAMHASAKTQAEKAAEVFTRCIADAKEFTLRLSALVKTDPAVVAEYLDLELLTAPTIGSTTERPPQRLPSGEITGYYPYKYLNIRRVDPDLRGAIASNQIDLLARCKSR